jgi:hypothetical protein
MAIKIVKVKEAIKDNGIKILVHAPAGTGKTVLAATACETTLIISAESGLLSLNNDELKEINPHFMPELCDVVEVATIEELEEVYVMLLDQIDDPQWEWISLDSITEIAEVVLANELEAAKDPRKAYGELYNRVSSLLRAFRDLPSYNVYMASKQTPIKDDYSGLVVYSPMMPGAKLGNSIPYLFDEVLCLRVLQDEDGGDYRVLQTSRDIQFEAKDRSGKLDKFEAPSLKRIADKIRGKFVEEKTGEEVEEKVKEMEVAAAKEKAISEDIVDSDSKLNKKEYYWNEEINHGGQAETINEREAFLEAGYAKVTKVVFDKHSKEKAEPRATEAELKAQKAMSKGKEEARDDKADFAETLKTLDKQDLVGLAIKLDEEIDQEVADDADVETLVEWIIESSMEDIKEAAKEIGLA